MNTLGDLLLECLHDEKLFEYLDNFGGSSWLDLVPLLTDRKISGLKEEKLIQLFAHLQNVGMRIWLHELRIWSIAHPAPVTFSDKRGTIGNWTPG
jgi:hypothetical protein